MEEVRENVDVEVGGGGRWERSVTNDVKSRAVYRSWEV